MPRLSLLLLAVGVGADATDAAPTNATHSIFFADGGVADDVHRQRQVDDTVSPTTTPAPPPTPKPSVRCRPNRPCLTPKGPAPTSTPSLSPIVSSPMPFTLNLMVYVENVPGRPMSEKEEEDYVEVMTNFLRGNEELNRNGLRTNLLSVSHSDILPEEEEARGRGKLGGVGGGDGGEGGASAGGGFIYTYHTESQYVPHIHPVAVIFTRVEAATKLPLTVSSFFFWDQLRQGEGALIEAFYNKRMFNSYFKDATNITSEVVERLTKRPTPKPTELIVLEEATTTEEDESQRNILVDAGIALACIWIVLTLFSFRRILKYRQKAKRIKKLEEFTSQKRSKLSQLSARTRQAATVAAGSALAAASAAAGEANALGSRTRGVAASVAGSALAAASTAAGEANALGSRTRGVAASGFVRSSSAAAPEERSRLEESESSGEVSIV